MPSCFAPGEVPRCREVPYSRSMIRPVARRPRSRARRRRSDAVCSNAVITRWGRRDGWEESPFVLTEFGRLAARETDYPQHVGVTEAGTYESSIVKSAMGIGALLLDGIGDTIRVSITGDPVREVEAGIEILRAAGLRGDYVEVVSCPTCARASIDIEAVATKVREATRGIKRPLRVAVMGCVVNGPGEAREADIGIAGGRDGGALFVKGHMPRTVRGDLAEILISEIRKLLS